MTPCQHITHAGKPCPNFAVGTNSDGRASCHVHYENGTYRKQQRAKGTDYMRLFITSPPPRPEGFPRITGITDDKPLEPIGKVAGLLRMAQQPGDCPFVPGKSHEPNNQRPAMTPEAQEILDLFRDMLAVPTGDGASKRAKGIKPHWKVDPGHEAAIFSHLAKWKKGEMVDADSGAHPLVHMAWRCLAIAWVETNRSKT